MTKQLRLTIEELAMLKKFDNDALQFFAEIKDHKSFPVFVDLVNTLIDMEKNLFFGEDESRYTETVWQAKHAYARGGIAKLIQFLHIIMGANTELTRRDQERKKD